MNEKRLIIRTDDVGFCHGANAAIERILTEGVVTAVSVIANTPWAEEASRILKRFPDVSVGVHSCLNAEWEEYRWGPVSPRDQVKSLVDSLGRFFGSRKLLMQRRPLLNEVETEIRSQVEQVMTLGLNPSYIDTHMGTTISTREFQEIIERLADHYRLGISRYFGEIFLPSVYALPPEEKTAAAIKALEDISEPGLYIMVFHPGTDSPEMAAMNDVNAFGLQTMSKHRQAETDVLCSGEFKAAIFENDFKLTDYNELLRESFDKMKRPFTSADYEEVVWEAIQEK